MSLLGLLRFGTVAREFIMEEAYGGRNHPSSWLEYKRQKDNMRTSQPPSSAHSPQGSGNRCERVEGKMVRVRGG